MKDTTDTPVASQRGEPAGKQLRATGRALSESSTTNIPPRLPEGFSYSQATETAEDAPTSDEELTPSAVTGTPEDVLATPLRTDETVNHAEGRVQKPQKTKGRKGGHVKHIVWSIVLIVFILATGAAFHFWIGIPASWRRDTPQPVVAADTLTRKPQPKPQPVDTAAQALSPEDSLRIQDSIRHARWLYWQQRRRNAQQTEQQGETTPAQTTETSTEGSAPAVKHATDSVG